MSKLFNKKTFSAAKELVSTVKDKLRKRDSTSRFKKRKMSKDDRIKTGLVAAAGTGVVGLGVLKAKSILDKDTRENTTSRDVYMQKEKKNKK